MMVSILKLHSTYKINLTKRNDLCVIIFFLLAQFSEQLWLLNGQVEGST